jgi:ribosomal protein S18 acetylase RimI-like enzyme
MIKKLDVEQRADELASLLRTANRTVAREFNLTPENAPTNPAFIDSEDILRGAKERSIVYYGYFLGGILVGCFALEDGGDGVSYLERVAVDPDYRHRGIGKKLVRYASRAVFRSGGRVISIGIINESGLLKRWYEDLGFVEKGLKRFEHLPFTVCFMERRRGRR